VIRSSKWLLVLAAIGAARPAHAECPTTPDDPVCRPWSAILLPTVFGQVYVPHGLDGAFVGGGVEAVVLAWSDNSQAFGPSQGRIRIDVSGLTGTASDAPSIVMYRGGVQLGFERNASRAYAIPFFALDLGGMWVDGIGRRWFGDAGLGLYLVQKRALSLDVEVEGLVPFRDPSTLGGVTTRLGLSYALW
jgi:hypothetical protein